MGAYKMKKTLTSFGIILILTSLQGCGKSASLIPQNLAPSQLQQPRIYPDGKIVRRLPPTVAQKTQRLMNGQMTDVYWAALTEAERRSEYSAVVLNTTVERQNTSGTFSVLPASANYSKGSYRVTHEVFLGKQTACQPSTPSAGVVKTGVLLEIEMNLLSKKKGLNISNLVPVLGGISRNKLSGTLAIRMWGFGAASGILNSYLTPSGELSLESVTDAIEATAVARAILEDPTSQTTPYYIELIENSLGSCDGSPIIDEAGPAIIKAPSSTL